MAEDNISGRSSKTQWTKLLSKTTPIIRFPRKSTFFLGSSRKYHKKNAGEVTNEIWLRTMERDGIPFEQFSWESDVQNTAKDCNPTKNRIELMVKKMLNKFVAPNSAKSCYWKRPSLKAFQKRTILECWRNSKARYGERSIWKGRA